MIRFEKLLTRAMLKIVLGAALGPALAVAQDVPPTAPPAPAAPQAATPMAAPAAPQALGPVQATAPSPAPAPVPHPAAVTLEGQDWQDYSRQIGEYSRQAAEYDRQAAEQAREQSREQATQAREAAQQAREQLREQAQQAARKMRLDAHVDVGPLSMNLDLAPQQGVRGGVPPMPPMPTMPAMPVRVFGKNDNSLYGRGQSALDDHKYDQALDCFTEVVSRGGPKADGALYWKAYTLNKLGRRDDALAALSQLHTSFPNSHWQEDAKALELEVKQASGKPVSPESESDDDLKLMALNGLAQSDPARAFPLLEKLLKGPASPKLKKNAVYVLAINPSPQAQQLLEQIARGNGNPDLQITAIGYMLRDKQSPNRTQVLFDIYGSTNDSAVKRQIINALRSNNDMDHLMQIYKTEKDQDLRRSILNSLNEQPGNADLWKLYQSEATPEGKMMILDAMGNNTNTEALAQVARSDSDPKVRARAVRALASARAANLSDTLTSLYTPEQDPQVKRAIISELGNERNAKALVALFHKESTLDLKKNILNNLERMHTPEANELYMEILGK